MSHAPRLATIPIALGLTVSGVTLGATGSAPALPHPIALFGCHAWSAAVDERRGRPLPPALPHSIRCLQLGA